MKAPILRLFSTERRGNSRRPFGHMRDAGRDDLVRRRRAQRRRLPWSCAPAVGGEQAGDDAQQRGLAGAVRADHRDRLAGIHRHRARRTAPGSRRSPRRCWRAQASGGRLRRRGRPRSRVRRPAPPSAAPSKITSPWSSTTTRSTTRISTPMMCSTQTMVMPFSRADALQHVGGLLHLGMIEAVEALVGQQQPRLRRERARQLELLQRGRAEPVGGRCADRSAGRPAPAPPRPLPAVARGSRRGPARRTPTSATFSSNVRLRNGRGIWNVRPMPLWQMRFGVRPAISAPSKLIVPAVGAIERRRCS